MCRLQEQSALYKQWESTTLNSGEAPLLPARMFFSRNRGYPTSLLSVIPYDNMEEKARQERKRTEANHWLRIYKQPVRDWRGVSYKAHFQSDEDDEEDDGNGGGNGGRGGTRDRDSVGNNNSNSNNNNGGNNINNNNNTGGGRGVTVGMFGDHEAGECYRHDPSLIDDPDMTQGTHKHYQLMCDMSIG
jgi:hypothetical protein